MQPATASTSRCSNNAAYVNISTNCSDCDLLSSSTLRDHLQQNGLQVRNYCHFTRSDRTLDYFRCLRLTLQLPVILQGPALINTLQVAIPTEAAHIKTMVLVHDDVTTSVTSPNPAAAAAAAPNAAVVVLLLASHKVDVRAVAQHMQLPKGALRLATPEEAVASTGYELGCIPPLGEHLLLLLLNAAAGCCCQ